MGRLRKRRLIGVLIFILLVSSWSTLFLYAQEAPRTLTFDAKDADIREVLRAIALNTGINIIADKSVEGRVTGHLVDVPLDEGLKTLLEANGFTIQKTDNIYTVSKMKEKPAFYVDYSKGLLTVDATKADIKELLRTISQESGVNIIPGKELKEEVTIHITKTSLEDGLRTICRAYDYILDKKDGTYFISQAEKAAAFQIEVTEEKLLSVNVKDADIGELLRAISQRCDIDLVMYGTVKGVVNVRFEKVPLEKGLQILLKGTPYTIKKEDSIYLVGDAALTNIAPGTFTRDEVVRLNYFKASEVPNLLPPTIPATSIKVLTEQNAIVITGTEELIETARTFLEKIDKRVPQMMIEALIVEFSRDRDLDVDITAGWEKHKWKVELLPAEGASTFAYTLRGTVAKDYWGTLRALITEGKARIRANPRIAALNGQKATVDVGEVRYYKTSEITTEGLPVTKLHTIEYGISLEITPWVGEAKEITVEIAPKFSQLIGLGAEGLPEIGERTAQTTVRVKDGETIVIGGLMQTSQVETVEKVPLLGQIPGLGRLFSKTKKVDKDTELVIYITPYLLPLEEEVVVKEAEIRGAKAEARKVYGKLSKKERLQQAKECYKSGKRLYRDGNFPEALLEFKEALNLNPKHNRAVWAVAKTQRRLVEVKIESIEEEVKKHFKEGKRYYEDEKYFEATLEFNKALALDPTHKESKEYLSKIQNKLKEKEEKKKKEAEGEEKKTE